MSVKDEFYEEDYDEEFEIRVIPLFEKEGDVVFAKCFKHIKDPNNHHYCLEGVVFVYNKSNFDIYVVRERKDSYEIEYGGYIPGNIEFAEYKCLGGISCYSIAFSNIRYARTSYYIDDIIDVLSRVGSISRKRSVRLALPMFLREIKEVKTYDTLGHCPCE